MTQVKVKPAPTAATEPQVMTSPDTVNLERSPVIVILVLGSRVQNQNRCLRTCLYLDQ